MKPITLPNSDGGGDLFCASSQPGKRSEQQTHLACEQAPQRSRLDLKELSLLRQSKDIRSKWRNKMRPPGDKSRHLRASKERSSCGKLGGAWIEIPISLI